MSVVKILYSNTAGNRPVLVDGQVAFNQADGIFYYRDGLGNTDAFPMANPTAPDQNYGDQSSKVANTNFVQNVVKNMQTTIVGSPGPPAALNTLQKIAQSINNDANFVQTVQNLATGFIHYNQQQTLTAFQQATSCSNINAANRAGDTFTGDVNFPGGMRVGGGAYQGLRGDGANSILHPTGNGSVIFQGYANPVTWMVCNGGISQWYVPVYSTGQIYSSSYIQAAGALYCSGGMYAYGGDITAGGGRLIAGSVILSYYGYQCKQGVYGGFSNTFNWFWDGGGMECWVDATYVGSVYLLCDERVKDNIQPLNVDATSMINQMETVTFNWQNTGVFKDDGQTHTGFLASNLWDIYPGTVTGDPSAVDERGDPELASINYLCMIALLVKSVQELTARVTSLETRATGLEARVAALEAA